MGQIVTLRGVEAGLKRRLRVHLRRLGFSRAKDGSLVPPDLTKETYRSIHSFQRADKLEKNRAWIERRATELLPFFASGSEINPCQIRPRLELVKKETVESDLFRFAGLYWRIPISEGYGRRMRFLVWDDFNEKLIGLLALGDAVFNLKVRDDLIGWDHNRRAAALVNLMDAYVLGAVPPYNMLLGGKLVAALAGTKEVVEHFNRRYGDSVGIISGESKRPRLAAITTSSALGRSSVYNRLKLDGQLIYRSIGFTTGFGHFHIPDQLFDDLRKYLASVGDHYAHGFRFGQGPNWKIRAIRKVFSLLGLDPELLRHGLPREVFLCELASNSIRYLRGDVSRLRYSKLKTVAEIGELAKERWVVPRSLRDGRFREWESVAILDEMRTHSVKLVAPEFACIGR